MLGGCSWPLKYGVPQRLTVSPMLFNVYMEPMGDVIKRLGLHCHQHANDMQLILKLPYDLRKVVENLGCALKEVMSLMNKIKLNLHKMELLYSWWDQIQLWEVGIQCCWTGIHTLCSHSEASFGADSGAA